MNKEDTNIISKNNSLEEDMPCCFLCGAQASSSSDTAGSSKVEKPSPENKANLSRCPGFSGGGGDEESEDVVAAKAEVGKNKNNKKANCKLWICDQGCMEIHLKENCNQNGKVDKIEPEKTLNSGTPGEPHPGCWPFKAGYDPYKGRCLMAARDISRLETVLIDWPLVVAPQSKPVCLVCLRDFKRTNEDGGKSSRSLEEDNSGLQSSWPFHCQKCRMPTCSEDCSKKHTELFPSECALFVSAFQGGNEEMEIVLKDGLRNVQETVGKCLLFANLAEGGGRASADDPDGKEGSKSKDLSAEDLKLVDSVGIVYGSVGVIRLLSFLRPKAEAEWKKRKCGTEAEDLTRDNHHDEKGEEEDQTGNSSRNWTRKALKRSEWIDRLMDHKEDLKLDRPIWRRLEKIAEFLRPFYPRGDVERAFGILRVNSFGFTTPEGGEGRALYPLTSLSSHSCRPNMQHTQSSEDGRVRLVAQRDIKAGEELCLTYINQFQDIPSRQKSLREQWYFQCACPNCSDTTESGTNASALRCSLCTDGLLLPVPSKQDLDKNYEEYPWICTVCEFKFDYKNDITPVIDDAMLKWVRIQAQNTNGDGSVSEDDISRCEDYISELTGPLGRFLGNHHFIVKVKSQLIMLHSVRHKDSKNSVEVLKRRLELCKDVMKYLGKLDPGQTKRMGVFLLELNKAKMALAKLYMSKGQMDRMAFLKALKEGVQMEALAKEMLNAKVQ